MDWRARVDYVDRVLGNLLREYQGPYIPIRMLLRLIAAEGRRDGLSDDFVLCEVGWASVPLAVAYRYNVDPFDDASAAWLAVQEAEHDAEHYLDLFDTFADDRADLVWLVLLDYSIGTRAAEFVVRAVEEWWDRTYDEQTKPTTFRDSACEWTQKASHVQERERRYYGRQTCATVYARICKNADRVRQIYELPVSLEGTPHTAAAVRMDLRVLPFPHSKELRRAAKICNRQATPEEHLSAWKMVRRYIDRRFGRG